MKSPIRVTYSRQTAAFRIVSLMLAIATLWLMMATTNTFAYGQASDDISNTSTATASSSADWTQFMRDNMQRWNPHETVLDINNVGGLQLKWKVSGASDSPAVVNGVVYVRRSSSYGFLALDASTGVLLWSNDTAIGNGITDSPAVANGLVYYGTYAGTVIALNASTGIGEWSFATGDTVVGDPAVVDGVVYVASYDHNVYALDASTGAKLWSYTTGGQVYSSPAVVNGVVYIGGLDGNVYALNASTGAKLWSYGTGNEVLCTPAVANGVVYIASGQNMYALDANTGGRLWSSYIFGAPYSAPAIANGVVYIGGADGNLYALNATTGGRLWSFRTADAYVYSAPAVANGVVYVGSRELHKAYALNASTGALLWSYDPGALVDGSPTIVNGVLYFFGQTGGPHYTPYLYAFSLGNADLFLRIIPSATTVHQGDLLTFAFPVWNLGPGNAFHEVLNTQVPAGTTLDYVRISGTPGLGTCATPPYGGTGQIVCHENAAMAPNTTWTVRVTVKVTAPAGTVITANAATSEDTPDPNLANNMATASIKVQ